VSTTVMKGYAGTDAGMAGDGETGSFPGPEAGGGAEAARVPLRELVDDRLLGALLDRSRDAAGGLRLTGAGSMLGELVAAVLERALQARWPRTWAMSGMRWTGGAAGTRGTGISPRRCRPGSGRSLCRCPGTGPGRSSRC